MENKPTTIEVIVGGVFILAVIIMWAMCPGGLP
jgi:hypothetical protein